MIYGKVRHDDTLVEAVEIVHNNETPVIVDLYVWFGRDDWDVNYDAIGWYSGGQIVTITENALCHLLGITGDDSFEELDLCLFETLNERFTKEAKERK